jgi:hypothetical protein
MNILEETKNLLFGFNSSARKCFLTLWSNRKTILGLEGSKFDHPGLKEIFYMHLQKLVKSG